MIISSPFISPVNENDLIEPEFEVVTDGSGAQRNQVVGAYAIYCMQEQNKLQPNTGQRTQASDSTNTQQFGTFDQSSSTITGQAGTFQEGNEMTNVTTTMEGANKEDFLNGGTIDTGGINTTGNIKNSYNNGFHEIFDKFFFIKHI